MSLRLIATVGVLSLFTSTQCLTAEILDPSDVCPNGLAAAGKIDATEVCTLIVVAKNALEFLRREQAAYPTDMPPLASVSLNLKTGTATSAGGAITIFIVKIGETHKASNIQTLAIKLVPPTQAESEKASKPFSQTLADAIHNAFIATNAAVKASNIGLNTGSLSMSVQFGVENDTSGGLDTGKLILIPISLSAAGDFNTSNTQELVFEFSPPKK